MYCPRSSEIRKDVMVVPILAPNTIPAACSNDISPALTIPMVMAVEALEDCIITVITTPIRKALNGLDVNLSIYSLSLGPANSFKELPINSIPNMNKPKPPRITSQRISAKVIVSLFFTLRRITISR